MNLKSKVAVVTGGNSGIGKAIVSAFAREGAFVVVAGRRQNRNQSVAAEMTKAFDAKALAVETDVTREADCDALIAKTVSAFGKIDILVNNAGTGGGGRIVSTTTEDFERVMKTNLFGTFWCSRAALREMEGNKGDGEIRGMIFNISSLAGKFAWSGTGVYSASKFGIIGLTQALADEGKETGIKVCAICPAKVATPMTEVKGPDYIQPEDIAATVLYLAHLSPAAWPVEIVLPRKGAD